MKFVLINNEDNEKVKIIEAENKHMAIAKFAEHLEKDMKDFYYGLDDGQISVREAEEI